MKKLFILLAAAGVAFSCSDDDTDPVVPNYEFDVTVNAGGEFVKAENTIYFPVEGGLVTFGVTAEEEWTPNVTGAGFSTQKLTSSFNLIAAENTSGHVQKGVLTITSGEGTDAFTVTYNIFQSGEVADISTDAEAEVPGDGGETVLTVLSTHEWDVSTESEWLTAEKRGENELVLSAGENDGDERTATVLIFTTEEEYNYAQFTITVTQSNKGIDLIIELTIPETASVGNPVVARLPISSTNFQSNTPFRGVIDCVVDWGDGTQTTYYHDATMEETAFVLPTHEYTQGGVFDVTVAGTVECLVGVTSSATGWTADQKALVTAVKQWGKTGLKHVWQGFAQMENLKTIPTDQYGSLSEVTHLYHMFYQCRGLEEIPEGIFDYATKNTTCRYIFNTCPLITEVPDGLFANMPLCTNVENAFANCSSLRTIGERVFGYKPELTDMALIFNGCSSLEAVPADLLSGVPNLLSCRYMFSGCTSLRTVPVSLFDNNTKIVTWNGPFSNCSSIVGESPYTEIGGTKIHIYERANYTSYFETPGTYGGCFSNAGFSDMENVPTGWK